MPEQLEVRQLGQRRDLTPGRQPRARHRSSTCSVTCSSTLSKRDVASGLCIAVSSWWSSGRRRLQPAGELDKTESNLEYVARYWCSGGSPTPATTEKGRRVPYADISGQRYFYEDTGGSDDPIIFLHGLNMDHEMFEPQIEHLRGRYRCIAWDARGHGATEETDDSFDLWDQAEDAVQLLGVLGLPSAIFVGMSQGGFMTLRAAIRHPERVRAMVLIDTEAGVQDAESLPLYKALFDDWYENGPAAHEELISNTLLGDPALATKWRAKWHEWDRRRVRNTAAAVFARDDIHDALATVTAPALVVHGTADPAISMEKAERLCDALPNCRGLVRVEGGTHAANLTHPDVVNREIDSFLDALVP